MRISNTLAIALLASAALLPALPTWADPAPPAAAQAGKTTPTPAPVPSAQAPAPAPLTVTGKPQQADNGSRERAMQTRRDDRKAFMDARLAALHAGLELTPQQQPLWDPVEGALRDLARARHAMRALRREDMDPTAPLKQRGERLVAMGQAIGKLADAAGPLDGSLTAEQKGRLPALLRGMGPHRLVKQAFAVEDSRGREGMRGGMRGGGMREGERGWHSRFADRDGGQDEDYGRSGMDRSGVDRSGMDRDGEGWHRHHFDRDRDGRANRDGMDGRYEGGRYRHENDEERVGG